MSRRGGRRPAPPAPAPSVSRRALILFGAQLAAAGGLSWRLRQLQIEQGDAYRQLAEENRVNLRLIAPERGEVVDRAGRPLAVNRQNLRVVVIRERAGDPKATLERLAQVIPIEAETRERALRELVQKSPFVPVLVAEHLSWEAFARVNANLPALPGVVAEVGLTRRYPEAHALSHVVGHVGPVSERDREAEPEAALLRLPDFQIGKTGVEQREEARLRGVAGASRIEINAAGRVIRELGREEPRSGADLQLTLDLDLQRYAMTRMGEESAATVVMDVRSGELLCLASAPGFDPNDFVRGVSHRIWNALLENDHRPLANKTVSGQYPPGSTFKMAVALAALKRGLVTPGETVFCNGGYKLGNRRFHCWKRGGHGFMDCRSALEESCDVYFYDVARRVGVDGISEAARRLGLGERLELPLTALRDGLMPTREWKRRNRDEAWQVGDTLNAGIGQGFTLATPLQLATMTARLASGRAVEPRLIRAVGGRPEPAPEAPSLEFPARDLALVREAMADVVNGKRGTARRSRFHHPEIRMAGKTGTSQVRRITMAERARGVTRNEDLPWNRRDHALFVAYAPVEAPRYACAVVVEHGGGGSKAAAPIARDVLMRAVWGATPPVEAYPPDERPGIELRRNPPLPPLEAEAGPRRRA
jgi:penicillin-binding protein 2